jgi:F-type H+-transporting ATPase subunit epsilon
MADALPTRLNLALVTPDRLVAREAVSAVFVPGREGYLGILPGHAPLLSELKPGELSYVQEGGTHYLAVSGGFVEVLPDRVIVLTSSAERPEDIDVERAERAKARAEERLRKASDPEIDEARALAALARALNRLAVARRAGVRAAS